MSSKVLNKRTTTTKKENNAWDHSTVYTQNNTVVIEFIKYLIHFECGANKDLIFFLKRNLWTRSENIKKKKRNSHEIIAHIVGHIRWTHDTHTNQTNRVKRNKIDSNLRKKKETNFSTKSRQKRQQQQQQNNLN